jgi:hypothetical protein
VQEGRWVRLRGLTMKYLIAFIAALALVGCEQSPTALEPTSSPTAQYQAFPIASDGYRLIPGGQVRWDTSLSPNKTTRYDASKEVLVSVDSMWVDTGWGVISRARDQVGHIEEAIFAANKKSKQAGFDTVYSWDSISGTALYGVKIHNTNGYRIPSPREAKYLLWAGSTLSLTSASGDFNAEWAKKNAFGDSLSGIKNNFGSYVFCRMPGAKSPLESFTYASGLEDPRHIGMVFPPCFSGLESTACGIVHFSVDDNLTFYPLVFVRSAR